MRWSRRSRNWTSFSSPWPRRERPLARACFAPRSVQGSFTSGCRLMSDERGEQHASRRVSARHLAAKPADSGVISATELNARPRAYPPEFSRACRPTVSTWGADFAALRYKPVAGAAARVKAAKRRPVEGSLDTRGRSRKIPGRSAGHPAALSRNSGEGCVVTAGASGQAGVRRDARGMGVHQRVREGFARIGWPATGDLRLRHCAEQAFTDIASPCQLSALVRNSTFGRRTFGMQMH
jgi:hypothetical protein